MTEIWLLYSEKDVCDGMLKRVVGLFTSKEVGMIAAKEWGNREAVKKKLLHIDDQEGEVHFGFGGDDGVITEYLVLEVWALNKTLIDGKWKVLDDTTAEGAIKKLWDSPDVKRFRGRRIDDPWPAASVAFFLGAGFNFDTAVRLSKELGY